MLNNVRCTVSIAVLSALVFMSAAGCGSQNGAELGNVTGKVTLDGRPLPNAIVVFQPVSLEGTYSSGRTNEKGNYILRYSRDKRGAIVGKHRVLVSTGASGSGDEEGTEGHISERVPVQYNLESDLVEEVLPGPNTIDLDLSGGGRIGENRKQRR